MGPVFDCMSSQMSFGSIHFREKHTPDMDMYSDSNQKFRPVLPSDIG